MSEQDKSPTANREPTSTENRDSQRKNARDNLKHAGEFTKIENIAGLHFLRGWIPEEFRQEDDVIEAADNVWALTVLFEHFDSELNSDARSRTRESRAILLELQSRADAAVERLKELTAGDDDMDDDKRMNELTDKTVKEVLEKLGL
jgi:hypothetical protein